MRYGILPPQEKFRQEVECGEYAVLRNLVSCNTRALTHTHTHTEGTWWPVGCWLPQRKLCFCKTRQGNGHTRPGDELFKMDEGNKCLSEKSAKKLFDGVRGRRTENPAKITVRVFPHPHFIQTGSGATRFPTDYYPMTTTGRACGKWSEVTSI